MDLRVDVTSIEKLGELLARAAKQVPAAVSLALNRTATETRTQMKRALQHQTGLPSQEVLAALRVSSASQFFLSSAVVARGRYISLKHFKATQNDKGVTASPWGKRKLFPHAFIVGKLGGNVFVRKGKERFPIHMLYGPAIPVEMVKGESAAAFYTVVPPILLKRLQHELDRLFKQGKT